MQIFLQWRWSSCWSPSEIVLCVLMSKRKLLEDRGGERKVQNLEGARHCVVLGTENCVDGGEFYLSLLTEFEVPQCVTQGQLF